jgi:hypothetical protein
MDVIKKWQIYKEVHGWTDISEDQRQLMKRKFYNEIIDKDFEKLTECKTKDDMVEF